MLEPVPEYLRMSVYSPLLGHIWRTLDSYGLDPRLAIEERLYRPGSANRAGSRMSFVDYDATIARAYELAGDPALGIHSAQFMHPSHLGALGHAWMASSSLREALRRLERFRHMFNEQVEIRIEERPDRVRMIYEMAEGLSYPDLVADGHLANILTLCRLNYGSTLNPIDVRLRRSEPADPGPWMAFYGPVVHFGQTEDSFSISVADADRSLTSSNSELVEIHEHVIQKYLSKLQRDNILNRTRLCIMEQLPSGRVTGDDLARELNMSERTLRRKLGEKGESFRSLLLNVRKDLARRYIRNENYSITEIAFLLGFGDSSAFSRAFRKWFGESPSEARDPET